MTTQLIIGKDPYSTPTDDIEISDTRVTGQLAADTDTSFVVPTGAIKALFSFTNNVWVSKAAITLPTAGSSSTTAAMRLNPLILTVEAGETLHLRARSTPDFEISYYS